MEGNVEVIFVLITLLGMLAVLVADLMRPGLVMFSVCVLFMCTGILSPKELLAGFSNEGMITVALLFLVSEGIRRSDALGHMISHILPVRPGKRQTARKGYSKLMPTIAGISAFLNNTPIVVIFIPIVKEWAAKAGLNVKKFLIPVRALRNQCHIVTLIKKQAFAYVQIAHRLGRTHTGLREHQSMVVRTFCL